MHTENIHVPKYFHKFESNQYLSLSHVMYGSYA